MASLSLFKRKTLASLIAMAMTFFASQAAGAWQDPNPVVVLETSKGQIVISVFLDRVPNTSRNFLDLVGRGFYDGLIFHRVESWCIQGGDPNGNGSGDFRDPQTGAPRYIPLEINRTLVHRRPGVVAMARNKNPNSASCQFYITKNAVPSLDGQYAIFGGVIDGLNTVMAIQPGDRILSARIAPNNSDNNNDRNNSSTGGAGSASSPNQQSQSDGRTTQTDRSGHQTKTTTDSGF